MITGIARIKIIKQVNLLINELNQMAVGIKKIKKLKELNELLSKLGVKVTNKLLELINQAKKVIDTNYQPLQFQSDYGQKLLNIADKLDTTTDPTIKQLANEVIGTHRQAMIELAKNKANAQLDSSNPFSLNLDFGEYIVKI